MSDFPDGFIADLRRLRSWPSLEGSLWREPYLVEATYGFLHQVVDGLIGLSSRVLDVGCGTGFLSLELARQGHRVVGIDTDRESIELATRTAESDPGRADRSSLTYLVAEFPQLPANVGKFDAVLLSRVLHHVADPAVALLAARQLLAEGGRVVCLEFAYDLFDRRAAIWLWQLKSLLEAAGMLAAEGPEEPGVAVDRVVADWHQEHAVDEPLNTFEEMRAPFLDLFREELSTRHPYLYWELLEGLVPPNHEIGARVADLLRQSEALLIEESRIPAVLSCWVGSPRR